MVKATTITIPSKEFASGYTLFCESKPEKIKKDYGSRRVLYRRR